MLQLIKWQAAKCDMRSFRVTSEIEMDAIRIELREVVPLKGPFAFERFILRERLMNAADPTEYVDVEIGVTLLKFDEALAKLVAA